LSAEHPVKLCVATLTYSQLEGASHDLKAATALASLAVNDLNMIMKMYLCTGETRPEDKEILVAFACHRSSVLRIWSSKLFEFRQFVEGRRSMHRSSDKDVREILDNAKDELAAAEDPIARSLARSIRNELSNHYSLSAARKNLRHVPDDADCSLYLHEKVGNSFYPMGDVFGLIGTLSRLSSSVDQGDLSALHDRWFAWCERTTRWVQAVHRALLLLLLERADLPCECVETLCSAPSDLCCNLADVKFPLFVE
jgi:hypothetical protein